MHRRTGSNPFHCSGFRYLAFQLLALLALSVAAANADPGGDPPPVIVNSIEPTEIVQGQVPQPTLQIFGSDFIEGFPNETNRPTVTLRQPGKGGAEFSALAWVNFAGTVATLPADLINLLPAPLGVYDVIVTRPTDGASDTLERAFTVTDGEPEPGEIALMVRSAWGGPVNDGEVVGNLAYAAIGRRLVILNVADPANPFEVGSINIMSGVNGVTVRDGYAFLAASEPYRFSVVDVSDPTNLRLISAGLGDHFSGDVELYGNLAYMRSLITGIDVFDINDPHNPVYLGEAFQSVAVKAMTIVGDLLYFGTKRLCVGEPTICFVAFRVYDLAADPLDPPLLGEVWFNATTDNYGGGTTHALAVEGDYAVWTLRKNNTDVDLPRDMLLVVDISDPATPVIVGTHDDGSDSFLGPVALSGGLAYVADYADSGAGGPAGWVNAKGLAVFDIATDPTNPTVVGTFKPHGNVTGVEIVGDRAYVHDDGEGLIILDVTDPTKPVRLGNYHSPAVMRHMAKEGDLLYVADAWNGFTVLDVSDAAHPEVVSVYLAEHVDDLGLNTVGIVLQDDRVYLGTGHLGLEVIDVSNPADPTFLGAFRIPSNPVCTSFRPVALSDDVAHVGWYKTDCGGTPNWSFINLDVSDPASIFELADLGPILGGPPRQIVVNDQGIAFIGPNATELTINTFDPEFPFVVQFGDIESVVGVALDGNVLYLASDDLGGDPEPGLYIQDVSNPSSPQLLAHVDQDSPFEDGTTLGRAFGVRTQNNRAYVVGMACSPLFCADSILLLDAIVRASPTLIDMAQHVGGSKSSLFVNEPYIYSTSEFDGPNITNFGLVILETTGLSSPGDLDGDGSVGASDLLILLASWGPCPPKGDCPADLDGNGSVGAGDLLILLANWG